MAQLAPLEAVSAGTKVAQCVFGPFAPAGLEAIRNIVREEIARAGLATTINEGPQIDAASLLEIVAGDIRAVTGEATNPRAKNTAPRKGRQRVNRSFF